MAKRITAQVPEKDSSKKWQTVEKEVTRKDLMALATDVSLLPKDWKAAVGEANYIDFHLDKESGEILDLTIRYKDEVTEKQTAFWQFVFANNEGALKVLKLRQYRPYTKRAEVAAHLVSLVGEIVHVDLEADRQEKAGELLAALSQLGFSQKTESTTK